MTAIPLKLRRAIKEHKGRYHRIANALGVNVYWVHRFLKNGIEPKNKEVRAKMGFPPLRKKHTGRSGFAELPEYIKWWRKLDKGSRDQHIRNAYDYIVTVR